MTKEIAIKHLKSHLEISEFYNSQKKSTLNMCEIEQERFSSGFVIGAKEIAKAFGVNLDELIFD